jgi:colanic acid biosynthesis glycosyl transferase WcaI
MPEPPTAHNAGAIDIPSTTLQTTFTPTQQEALATTSERKRILIYGMNFTPEFAGVGRYTGEIALQLSAEGASVRVITTPPHYPGWRVQAGYTNSFAQETIDGLKITRCPLVVREKMRGIWRLLAPFTFAVTSGPVAILHILLRRPHVVICVEPTLMAAPAAAVAAKLVGARTVLHVQDLEVDAAFAVGHLRNSGWLKRLAGGFERFCLRQMDEVITISHRMADRLKEKGVAEDRVTVVRNWVDLDAIYPLPGPSPYRRELGYGPDDFVVMYSGNIGAKQGLDVLLVAAAQLAREEPIKFVVAGEGPEKPELQKRFGHLPNVQFLPFQPAERLNAFLNLPNIHVLTQMKGAADLVLPSKLGGMLASGKGIIVTAEEDTELAEFLDDVAIVIPPGSPEALRDAILAAHRDALGLSDRSRRGRLRSEALGKRLNLALIRDRANFKGSSAA